MVRTMTKTISIIFSFFLFIVNLCSLTTLIVLWLSLYVNLKRGFGDIFDLGMRKKNTTYIIKKGQEYKFVNLGKKEDEIMSNREKEN